MMNRHDAYTAMLSRHRHVIWAMCRDHAHGQWDDCCDLVQEVSLRLWLEFDRLRPGATPKEEREWVRWVARKVFYLEGRKRRLSTQPLGSEAAAVPASVSALARFCWLTCEMTFSAWSPMTTL